MSRQSRRTQRCKVRLSLMIAKVMLSTLPNKEPAIAYLKLALVQARQVSYNNRQRAWIAQALVAMEQSV